MSLANLNKRYTRLQSPGAVVWCPRCKAEAVVMDITAPEDLLKQARQLVAAEQHWELRARIQQLEAEIVDWQRKLRASEETRREDVRLLSGELLALRLVLPPPAELSRLLREWAGPDDGT